MSDTTPELSLIENKDPTYSIIVFKASDLPKSYEPMLYSRWLRSLRTGNQTFKKISSNAYFENYHKFISNLLNKPDSLVRLAVLSDDHDVVLGFAVSREDVLDYIHVHTDYRRIGIGTALVPEGITTFSHITVTAIIIWQKNQKYKHLQFNPFA
jgi:GNAT superfamily N-acetyltransferase